MRKPEQSPEPSIEEILSSIRRIIADDGGSPKESAAGYPRQVEQDRDSSDNPDPYAPPKQSNAYARPAPPEPQRSRDDDEILELTEDFLIEEEPPHQQVAGAPTTQGPNEKGKHGESAQDVRARDLFAVSDDSDDLGLQTVLSNVAAEVDRLASGDVDGDVDIGMFSDKGGNAASPETDGTRDQPAPPPMPDLEAETSRPASTPASQSNKPRLHSRPVWSARRLEEDTASAKAPADHGGEDHKEKPHGNDAPQRPAMAGADRWTEGVQMPVPDTGPEMPFPYATEAEATTGMTPPGTETHEENVEAFSEDGGAPAEELEREKGFVGDFLNRVFGNSSQRADDDTPLEDSFEQPESESGLKEKAEYLAKSTVSDFASDKLGAPGVADALYADKPFMDQITESLESALSEAEATENLPERDEAPRSVRQELPPDGEMPEPPPPPGEDFGGYGEFDPIDLNAAEAEDEPRAAEAEVAPEKAAPQGLAGPISSTVAHPDPMFGGGEAKRQQYPAPGDSSPRAETSQRAPAADPRDASSAPQAAPQMPTSAKAPQPVDEPPPLGPIQLPSGIEDSIKDMLKPLIVQWLNDNLARIVEQAVREELAERRESISQMSAAARSER